METITEGFKGEKAIITPYNIREYQSSNKITQQLYITHIGYYPNAKHHFRIRETGGTENILIYCVDGSGWIIHKGVKYTLKRNQAYLIPQDEEHSYGSHLQKPWSIYWLHFKGERAEEFRSMSNNVINIDDTDSSRQVERLQLFDEIFQNLEMGYQPENLEYISYCLLYFLASLKYLTQYREINRVKVDDVIQKSIMYMKNNIESKITLEAIAQHVNYSKSHLISLFTDKTSYSPIIYFNQLRIQRACTYLQFSDLKIKEIAYRLCFYDPFHFSKAFLKEMGISPSEYRKKYKE